MAIAAGFVQSFGAAGSDIGFLVSDRTRIQVAHANSSLRLHSRGRALFMAPLPPSSGEEGSIQDGTKDAALALCREYVRTARAMEASTIGVERSHELGA